MAYRISVVTGTRAEFGLLLPVIKKLSADPRAEVLVAVTGAHLSKRLGYTRSEISSAGIVPDFELDIGAGEPGVGNVESMTRAISGFYEYYRHSKPDAVLLLGDRYEIFAAALAAVSADVPVAHISGGDTTEGARDEYYRHCITKLASLHFPSCEAYRRRVIQLGEAPETVFNVGSLGAENIATLPLLDAQTLSEQIDFDCTKPYFLVTYHPETLSGREPVEALNELLSVLDELEASALITRSNADDGAQLINERLEQYSAGNKRTKVVSNLGALRYLSAMKHCTAVLGNSSSGIVETPSFKKPTVDIGNRQRGRLCGKNTIHCRDTAEEIASAIAKVCSKDFLDSIAQMENPYESDDTSGQIVAILLESLEKDTMIISKSFFDVNFRL